MIRLIAPGNYLKRASQAAGEYSPHVALPSIVKLAEQYGVATGTVQRAMRISKREGVVVGVPGYGTFVAER